MRIFIIVFIFDLGNSQFPSKANDISDFEIEGLSIGDSLLSKYSKKEIEDFYKAPYYEDNEYTTIESLKLPDDSQYDYISYTYKTSDRNYSIVGIVADITTRGVF